MNSTKITEHTMTTNVKENDRPSEVVVQNELFVKIKAENDKLWEYIQKGEKNTEFLKNCFGKILDNMSTKGEAKNGPQTPMNHKIINNMPCQHCHGDQ